MDGPGLGRHSAVLVQCCALVGEGRKQVSTGISRNVTICSDFHDNSKKTIAITTFLIKAVAEFMNLIFM